MKKALLGLLSLSILLGIPSTSFAATYNEYEPNNYHYQANPFVIGNEIEGSLPNSIHDYKDYFKFTPDETATYKFSIAYATGQRVKLKLANSNASVTYGLAGSGFGTDSFTYTLTAGTTYILQVYNGGVFDLDKSDEYKVFTTKVQ